MEILAQQFEAEVIFRQEIDLCMVMNLTEQVVRNYIVVMFSIMCQE